MAETSITSNNPFRRRSATPSAAVALPSGNSLPPSAGPDLPHFSGAKAAGSSGSSAAAFLFEQHLQSLQHPTGDEFRDQLRALPKSTEAPPSTTFLNPKPVKKVRVQSPPSSPESVDADFEARFPAYGAADTATASVSGTAKYAVHFADTPGYDEYSSGSEDTDDDRAPQSGRDLPTVPSTQPVPTHNPFHKTLGATQPDKKDEGGESPVPASIAPATAPTVGKAPLNVDAFRRLLMTGQADGSGTGVGAAGTDLGSFTDASSTSKHSTFDTAHIPWDSPRSSHEISGAEDDRSRFVQGPHTTPSQRQTPRKKPPPPSSRHGKLISSTHNVKEAADEVAAAMTSPHRRTSGGSIRPSSSSSDMNKPLPVPPILRSTGEKAESLFDREIAGRIPEVDINLDALDDAVSHPHPPTPPNASHAITLSISPPPSKPAAELLASSPPLALPAPTQTKKPTPPPRRQMAHARSDSRSSIQDRVPSAQSLPSWAESAQDRSPEASRRSSFESTRSISSSLRVTINAPAPPPPRRPHHAARLPTSYISPTVQSFPSMPSAASSPSIVVDGNRSSFAWNNVNVSGQVQPVTPTTLGTHFLESTSPGAEVVRRDAVTVSGLVGSVISGSATPAKLAKPPPPPARSISVRKKESKTGQVGDLASGTSGRPSSVLGVDALSHRVQAHLHQHPPPPPPRARGSSRGSTDGPLNATDGTVTPRKGSNESSYNNPSASAILADLSALQREVDALRGQFSK
ncbi:hypothetical protein CMQ_5423 [Grosmannia clavigera kw1407]|uniref:Uncharacterized protein n=1 Tax=Grosmannia clavigera (strain kw1407 / UAMH 11150) TaxID=655863 RepID=F0XG02_GROCL|nr:uncharacterized protein CMQ_5423 [Grosmannia clavigera kw1407]EFX03373.1 hypothetical protein CMQ_5423 [Grosmannia clavigera kw1407]